jgi:hypothetical protein
MKRWNVMQFRASAMSWFWVDQVEARSPREAARIARAKHPGLGLLVKVVATDLVAEPVRVAG